MVISVASGKGGTGKTTIATSMALSLEGKVRILDCDVEEPNVYLFLHPEMKTEIPVNVPVPAINEKACNRCGKCAQICRFNAIAIFGKVVLTFPELCHGCGGCMEICPEKAITEDKRRVGTIQTGFRQEIEFIHGKLRVGEAMAPPLIRAVTDHVKPELCNIIDAPPGTSCPVISAIRNTDFVLLVTEPTPFGLHDLQLAVEAVRVLGIPHGIIINRSDIGDASVKDYAESRNIPILIEIPFDRAIASAYSKGITIVEAFPEWKDRFLKVYRQIVSIVERKGASL